MARYIAKKYLDEGMNKYTLGDYAGASVLFEKAAGAAATKPLSKTDTTALYNAGFTAWMVKDYPRAKDLFEKCLAAEYYYEGGIIEYVQYLNRKKKPIHNDVIVIEHQDSFFDGQDNQNVEIELAFQYTEDDVCDIRAFTNNIANHEGGTHEDGVKRALTRIINKCLTRNILSIRYVIIIIALITLIEAVFSVYIKIGGIMPDLLFVFVLINQSINLKMLY